MEPDLAIEVAWRTPGAGPGGGFAVPAGACRLVANQPIHPIVIGIAGQSGRENARRAIRQAIRDELCAMFGVAPERIVLCAEAGQAQAPYALLKMNDGFQRIGLAISHDGALSLAAIRADGAVGIDVMQVTGFPDLDAVARDYLGPEAAAAFAQLAPAERLPAFARAWSGHEARLKCLGRELTEWSADLERELAACRCLPLALPEGYTGALALPP